MSLASRTQLCRSLGDSRSGHLSPVTTKESSLQKENANDPPDLYISQEILYSTIKGYWLPGRVTQIGWETRGCKVTAPTGATNRQNKSQLEALHYKFIPNTSTIGTPIHCNKNIQHFTLQLPIHIKPHPKRIIFDLNTEETSEWCIVHSEEPSKTQTTLPDKPLPTTAEDFKRKPASHTSTPSTRPSNITKACSVEPKVPCTSNLKHQCLYHHLQNNCMQTWIRLQ